MSPPYWLDVFVVSRAVSTICNEQVAKSLVLELHCFPLKRRVLSCCASQIGSRSTCTTSFRAEPHSCLLLLQSRLRCCKILCATASTSSKPCHQVEHLDHKKCRSCHSVVLVPPCQWGWRGLRDPREEPDAGMLACLLGSMRSIIVSLWGLGCRCGVSVTHSNSIWNHRPCRCWSCGALRSGPSGE